jgi:hypothetical protein
MTSAINIDFQMCSGIFMNYNFSNLKMIITYKPLIQISLSRIFQLSCFFTGSKNEIYVLIVQFYSTTVG